jgi:hypothetical protein
VTHPYGYLPRSDGPHYVLLTRPQITGDVPSLVEVQIKGWLFTALVNEVSAPDVLTELRVWEFEGQFEVESKAPKTLSCLVPW